MEIILASQSPRRRELLERMGIKNFRIVTPDIDEHMERELPPEELVRRISAEKARAVRVPPHAYARTKLRLRSCSIPARYW